MMSTILIIDDSAVMRNIIKKNIKAANLIVGGFIDASDGREALEKIKCDVPDLILCDWNMPNMTGIEFIRTLNSSAEYGHIPVVVVTTEGSDVMRREATEAGAKGYLTKPFTPDQLTTVLGQFLMVS